MLYLNGCTGLSVRQLSLFDRIPNIKDRLNAVLTVGIDEIIQPL